MTLPTSYALSGNDAHILQGLYCDTFTFFRKNLKTSVTIAPKPVFLQREDTILYPYCPVIQTPKKFSMKVKFLMISEHLLLPFRDLIHLRALMLQLQTVKQESLSNNKTNDCFYTCKKLPRSDRGSFEYFN